MYPFLRRYEITKNILIKLYNNFLRIFRTDSEYLIIFFCEYGGHML